MADSFDSMLADFEKQPAGVYVKASTLGSLEALLTFLTEMKVPVFDFGIGEVHKKDVNKAAIMTDRKAPQYAVILAFDVKVNESARKQSEIDKVRIFTADIIYNLFDAFKIYMDQVNESNKTKVKDDVVFPVILEIEKGAVYNKKSPLIFVCEIKDGQLRPGTPLCLPDKDFMQIGRVASIEVNRKPVEMARAGTAQSRVCIKVEQNTSQAHITYGRHFDHTSQLYSHISRQSIDVLKDQFREEMKKEDWALIVGMKKIFGIS